MRRHEADYGVFQQNNPVLPEQGAKLPQEEAEHDQMNEMVDEKDKRDGFI